MSRSALQHVMIRMLYDQEFASRVLSDPDQALAREATACEAKACEVLTPEERAWLLRPDPRAWRVDPERPLRALSVLGQEYLSGTALAVVSGGGVAPLRRFFSSSFFTRVVAEHGSMAVAFGDYLVDLVETGEIRDRRIVPLARLEQAVARLRRNPETSHPMRPATDETPREISPVARFRLSPDKMLHEAPAGTADLRDEIHDLLVRTGREFAQAIFDPGPLQPRTPIDREQLEPLLLERIPDGGPQLKRPVGVAEITTEFYSLLSFAAVPRTGPDLAAEAERLGADQEEAGGIIEGLIESRVLAVVA